MIRGRGSSIVSDPANFQGPPYVLLFVDLDAVLKKCRDGDQLAWEALVRSYQGRVYGIAWHYLFDPEEARDAAQEIFVRIYRNLTAEIEAERFPPWVMRIARNVCIDHLRKRKARRGTENLSPAMFSRIPDPRNTPEQHWEATSRRRLAHRALRQLSRLNREIILLKDIFGLPLEEIASQLRIPVGTVKSRCNRARIELTKRVVALCAARGADSGGGAQ
jgi:RNA polymerase sigma-70 factor, ECF subfamily